MLVVLFGAYVWKKTQEIAELKGLVRGLDQKDAALPSDRQLDQLFEMISRSQQGFRDLIDSFDDILLALVSTAKSAPSIAASPISSGQPSSKSSAALSPISSRRAWTKLRRNPSPS